METILERLTRWLRIKDMLAQLILAFTLHAQTLPAPTGPYAVGRDPLLGEDGWRIEPLAPKLGPRRILADVWYPAEPREGGNPAEYLAVDAFERAIGSALPSQLGAAYDAIRSGKVSTHAVSGAPFSSRLRRAPVLIFSPGGGMIRELYAAQLAELASHGYVVAAITHPYDGFAAVYPGGGHIAYDGKRWPKPPSLEGEANLNQLEWHAADLRFVLDELGRAGSRPFSGRLDLARAGAFGHSFGGIAAAHACQREPRLRAGLNQDGSIAFQPYFADARGWGMDQPFLLLERSLRTGPPSDRELAEMKTTRARVEELRARLLRRRDLTLRSTGKGSLRVVLIREGTSHMDFSDLPLLGAGTREEWETKRRVLGVATAYTRAFFDRHLKGIRSPPLEGKNSDPLVEAVETFAPAGATASRKKRVP